jgi:hypothetical protein
VLVINTANELHQRDLAAVPTEVGDAAEALAHGASNLVTVGVEYQRKIDYVLGGVERGHATADDLDQLTLRAERAGHQARTRLRELVEAHPEDHRLDPYRDRLAEQPMDPDRKLAGFRELVDDGLFTDVPRLAKVERLADDLVRLTVDRTDSGALLSGQHQEVLLVRVVPGELGRTVVWPGRDDADIVLVLGDADARTGYRTALERVTEAVKLFAEGPTSVSGLDVQMKGQGALQAGPIANRVATTLATELNLVHLLEQGPAALATIYLGAVAKRWHTLGRLLDVLRVERLLGYYGNSASPYRDALAAAIFEHQSRRRDSLLGDYAEIARLLDLPRRQWEPHQYRLPDALARAEEPPATQPHGEQPHGEQPPDGAGETPTHSRRATGR